jgi:hypothetical protein
MRRQPLLQDALGLALRDHQRVGKAAVDRIEADPGDDLLAGRDLGAVCGEAGRQEPVDIARVVEQLERATPQHQCLGLVGPRRRLVDDAHRHAMPHQLVGKRQPDRTGAGDQDRRTVGHLMFSPESYPA